MRNFFEQVQHERGQDISLFGGNHEEELVELDVHEVDAFILLGAHTVFRFDILQIRGESDSGCPLNNY